LIEIWTVRYDESVVLKLQLGTSSVTRGNFLKLAILHQNMTPASILLHSDELNYGMVYKWCYSSWVSKQFYKLTG